MLTNLHNKLTSKINCRTTLTRHKRQRIIFIRTVRFLCKLRQNHDLNLLLKIVRWNETFFHCDETLSRMISSSTRNRKELFVLQCNPEFKNRSGFDFFFFFFGKKPRVLPGDHFNLYFEDPISKIVFKFLLSEDMIQKLMGIGGHGLGSNVFLRVSERGSS